MLTLINQVHLVVTAILVGLIWVVQIIHYPSFFYVKEDYWEEFHRLHSQRISYLVAWLMPLELLMTIHYSYTQSYSVMSLTLLILVIGIFASTFFIQVPLHQKLSAGKDSHLIYRLVRTNWMRTIAWTLKVILMILIFTGF